MQCDLSKIQIAEIEARIEIVQWQITIAKDYQTLCNREERLKQLRQELTKRQSK
ncbi:hypothetical protein [Chryseobacterium sp. CCH4-E10]|uniref:hypothetical protein n=1 Tax=Chryseobacterium sp. CCH4-E10 TaxID=1768758 RepID=UPI000B2A3F91|nr:hypothetical protein [Chryseobacterium sp. CCH4-E10]